jgi:signal transduction histidine kinase
MSSALGTNLTRPALTPAAPAPSVPLSDGGAAARTRLSRFWTFQVTGWLAYGVAMAFSRLGIFPFDYMVVSKGLLTLMGLLCSLVLWRVYRRLLERERPIRDLIVAGVAASYLMALVWTAADNLVNIPVAAWLLDRQVVIRTTFELFVGSVYNAFTLLAWSLLYFGVRHHDALRAERERSLRAEAEAQRSQLEALRYQLHPHFLFNTLNAISTLVADGRNADAGRMISRLSDFLRLTLAAPAVHEVPLADEVDFVRRYLDIEQVRLGERLSVRVDVEPAVWGARVPYLLLQPIVENAVRHGVAAREDGGSVAIEARRHGRVLRIVVADDGPGWAGSSNGAPAGERIGLANTRARLRRLYGESHRLDIAADGAGVRVTMELPLEAAAPSSPPPAA